MARLDYYDECYYSDLTRQFISQSGEGDDAMFQLSCQLQYALTPGLRAMASGDRWCSSLEALAEFKHFAVNHPVLAVIAGLPVAKSELVLSGV